MKVTVNKLVGSVAVVLLVSAFAATPVWASKMGHKGKMAGTHKFDMGMKPILEQYLKVQESLAKDSTDGAQAAAKTIGTLAKKLDTASVKGEHAKHYKDIPGHLQKAATELAKATTVDAAREAFKKLSKPMAMWGTMSKPAGVDVVFCSMVKASWLQKHGDVQNPYRGTSMLSCGEVVGGEAHASAAGHGEHTH